MKGIRASYIFAALFAVGLLSPSALAAQTTNDSNLVIKTVTGIQSKGFTQLHMLDDIYHNEVIETHEQKATELTFLDESLLTLGPNARLTVDRFVQAPDANQSAFVITLTRGALRFSSGNFPSEVYVIHTPVATIGIKGTIIEVIVTPTDAADGTPTANVNVTVVEGEAEIINCDRKRTQVPTGLSSTVFGLEQGGCSDATIPGPRPDSFTEVFEFGDGILLEAGNPDAPDFFPQIGFIDLPEVEVFLENQGPTKENPSQVDDPTDLGEDPTNEASPNGV